MDLWIMCVTHCAALLFSLLTSLCLAANRGIQTRNAALDSVLNAAVFNKPMNLLPDVVNPSNNLTIEILPSDEEDEDNILSFGMLKDAYGFGDQVQDFDARSGFTN